MQKHHQEGFFHFIYVEPKYQRDEYNHTGANDFSKLDLSILAISRVV